MQHESPKQQRSLDELPKAEELYQRLKAGVANLIAKFSPEDVHLVGIYSGGAWLAERLKDFQDEKISEFAVNLMKEMSEGDMKRAEEITAEFYGELYDN